MAQPETEIKDVSPTDGLATVASDEVRKNLAELLARAGHKDERIVITLYGKGIVGLVPIKDLERLQALDAA